MSSSFLKEQPEELIADNFFEKKTTIKIRGRIKSHIL